MLLVNVYDEDGTIVHVAGNFMIRFSGVAENGYSQIEDIIPSGTKFPLLCTFCRFRGIAYGKFDIVLPREPDFALCRGVNFNI